MDYTTENLEKAVTLFYNSEAGQQLEAHQWLSDAQNSSQAWSFVWDLLNPQHTPEVQFFAATTLHTKILKYWNEVPEDHYELLKKRILEAIVAYAMGPKLVLNRLCLTLSAFVIHTIPNYWPNAFEELISSFQPTNLPNIEPERIVWILLEILSLIPEEFQSILITISQRNRLRNILNDVTGNILNVVEMFITPHGSDTKNLITYLNGVKCVSSWLQLAAISIDECSHIIELLINLVSYIYWEKGDSSNMYVEELEVIEMVLETLSSVMLQPQTHKYPKKVIQHALNILSKFGKILAKEQQSADQNKDIISGFYGLIVTIADTHAKIFINQLRSTNLEDQQLTIDLLNCVLSCSETPGFYPVDETCSNLTFGFWYTLQDDVLSMFSDDCSNLLATIKPYYYRLIYIMLNKSMYPSSWDDCTNANWSHDDKELFRCYRQDVSDTFMYSYSVLELDMLEILQTQLNMALTQCSSKPNEHWNAVESCLHAFSAVSECIEWENVYLPQLMIMLHDIPYKDLHVKVLATALDTVGSYSEWLSDRPNSLNHVIPLLILGLSNADVAPNATMALKDVAHNCQKDLLPHAEILLTACQVILANEHLQLSEHLRLMYALGTILSILPINKAMEFLNVILGTSIEDMQVLVNAAESTSTKTNLKTKLKLLSSLCNTLHVKTPDNGELVEQPVLILIQNIFPILMQIVNRYFSHRDVIDILCQLFKHTITTLMDDCKQIIPSILQLLVTIYTQAPNSSVVNLAKTILIMFSKEESLKEILNQLLNEIVKTTLQWCAYLNDSNILSEISDVLEEFFILLAQLLKKDIQFMFIASLDSTALFDCAVVCLVLPEVPTIKATTSFLVNFITTSRERNQAIVVENCGENLVHKILASLGRTAPRSAADIYSDIFLILNKKYCNSLARWLNTQLLQENFPSPLVTPQQKEYFIKLVLKERSSKRKLSEGVLEFSLICRGIIQASSNC